MILKRFGTRNISVTFVSPSKDIIRKVLERIKQESVELYSYNMKEVAKTNGIRYEVTMEMKVKRFQYEVRIFDVMSGFDGVEIESIE